MEMLNIWMMLKLITYGVAAVALVIYAIKLYRDYK